MGQDCGLSFSVEVSVGLDRLFTGYSWLADRERSV